MAVGVYVAVLDMVGVIVGCGVSARKVGVNQLSKSSNGDLVGVLVGVKEGVTVLV